MADGRHCFQIFKLAFRLYATLKHDIWFWGRVFGVGRSNGATSECQKSKMAADGHLGLLDIEKLPQLRKRFAADRNDICF